MLLGSDWWIWPFPSHLHVWQPDLQRLPLISSFPCVLAAAPEQVLQWWATWDTFPGWTAQCPPLLTATKWRRLKYVPWKAILPGVKSWDGKKLLQVFHSARIPQTAYNSSRHPLGNDSTLSHDITSTAPPSFQGEAFKLISSVFPIYQRTETAGYHG